MFNEITPKSYYYIKDLQQIYYAYRGLLYGKEDQTLLIHDEPSKVLWNPMWSGFFLESFKGDVVKE
jgi:hypothetical protein